MYIYCCPLFLYGAIIVKKYEATFCIHWAFAFISNLTLFFTQLVLQIQVTIKRKNTIAFSNFVAFSTYYTSQKVHHAFEVEWKKSLDLKVSLFINFAFLFLLWFMKFEKKTATTVQSRFSVNRDCTVLLQFQISCKSTKPTFGL